jgi:hypothetical protein
MDVNAIIATAITGLCSSVAGGGIVWKLMTRWMDDVDSKFKKTFQWLEKSTETFTTYAEHLRCMGDVKEQLKTVVTTEDCEKCERRLAEKREDRGKRIISLEERVHEVGVSAGELWGVILAKFPEIERRNQIRGIRDNRQ